MRTISKKGAVKRVEEYDAVLYDDGTLVYDESTWDARATCAACDYELYYEEVQAV